MLEETRKKRRIKMGKYGKLTKKEIKEQFDKMVENAKKRSR